MEDAQIIERIESFCFSPSARIISEEKDAARDNSHFLFVKRLMEFLRENQFYTIAESPLGNHNHWKIKERSIGKRTGYIDAVCFRNNKKIAIEYDNRTHLKFKSIEKLLQSNADIMIGIVKGRTSRREFISNRQRIIDTMRRLQIRDKQIHLIIIANKISERVGAPEP